MSKSQIKRLHEQKELEKSANIDEEEDDVPIQRKGPANRFAFFDDEDENQCSDDGGGDEQTTDCGQTSSANNAKKKKNRNKKNKKKKDGNENKNELTDDQLLELLSRQNEKLAQSSNEPVTATIEAIFKVDSKMFDPLAELKRALGKAFKNETATAPLPKSSRWKQTGRIIKSKPTWPPLKNIGLSMVHDREENEIQWFKFKHNGNYQAVERYYWMAEKAMSIDIAMEILSENWYHLNSLMMVANMYRMQDDVTQGADMIERGIYYCEQMFAGQFEPFSWRHRVDYLDYENRAFYLLLHRHMLNCAKKRCFETALNTAKFIFKLDPKADHLACLMMFDTLSIKARQYNWFIQFYEKCEEWKKLSLCPNMLYSFALAHFLKSSSDEDLEKADQLLEKAIKCFPTLVTDLLDELQIHPDALIMNHEFFCAAATGREKDGLKDMYKIYVKQSSDLWKEPNTLAWLEKVTRNVASDKNVETKNEMTRWRDRRAQLFHSRSPNVQRLAVLLELENTTSLSDPVPPKKGRTPYVNEENSANQQHSDNSLLGGFLHSLFPDYDPSESLNGRVGREMELMRQRLNEMLRGRVENHENDQNNREGDAL